LLYVAAEATTVCFTGPVTKLPRTPSSAVPMRSLRVLLKRVPLVLPNASASVGFASTLSSSLRRTPPAAQAVMLSVMSTSPRKVANLSFSFE
jgi:hypothetical protein